MGERRQDQRERLLEAAYDLVGEVGVSGLRTRDIAERAGVNLATLHYCFESKDVLVRALFEFIRGKFRAEVDVQSLETLSPEERVVAFTRLRVHIVRDMPASVRVWRIFIGEIWTNALVREIVLEHSRELRSRYAAVLAEGMDRGLFPGLPTTDPQIAASLLMALHDGLMFQWALDPEAFSLDEYAWSITAWLGVENAVRSNEIAERVGSLV